VQLHATLHGCKVKVIIVRQVGGLAQEARCGLPAQLWGDGQTGVYAAVASWQDNWGDRKKPVLWRNAFLIYGFAIGRARHAPRLRVAGAGRADKKLLRARGISMREMLSAVQKYWRTSRGSAKSFVSLPAGIREARPKSPFLRRRKNLPGEFSRYRRCTKRDGGVPCFRSARLKCRELGATDLPRQKGHAKNGGRNTRSSGRS